MGRSISEVFFPLIFSLNLGIQFTYDPRKDSNGSIPTSCQR